MNEGREVYVAKSRESLAGAQSELANRRYNNVANRAYFAAYQAAIAGLLQAGINRRRWDHDDVQAQFSALILTRKLFPTELRSVLSDLSMIRVRGDYENRLIGRSAAEESVRLASRFLDRVLR